jgi:hypothetical protein
VDVLWRAVFRDVARWEAMRSGDRVADECWQTGGHRSIMVDIAVSSCV